MSTSPPVAELRGCDSHRILWHHKATLGALDIPAHPVQGIELDTSTLPPQAVASLCLTVRHAPSLQGIEMDTRTSASLAQSLQAFRASGADRDVIDVVTQMVTKPMKVHPACCTVCLTVLSQY